MQCIPAGMSALVFRYDPYRDRFWLLPDTPGCSLRSTRGYWLTRLRRCSSLPNVFYSREANVVTFPVAALGSRITLKVDERFI